eukprot:CAMPEP_0167749328 /NCGR_PEP_ID=MMETSP0110_2-20121227/5345_1 /TAXON_ID=629695 /ORGANISM="Gymnochlora sp., Strain CCMP2014" /LENGTH=138 /DNA_ID=CAMNT_0007634467 /DNA_START=151 /DNA_END=567 /DNA_ORIENTATION=+
MRQLQTRQNIFPQLSQGCNQRSRENTRVHGLFDGLFQQPGAAAAADPMICIDCGYIYKKKSPTFQQLPANYKCPACGVGKSRFKVYKQQADYYNTLSAQKAANRKAAQAGPSSKRAELLRKQQQMQQEKDNKRKKGWF